MSAVCIKSSHVVSKVRVSTVPRQGRNCEQRDSQIRQKEKSPNVPPLSAFTKYPTRFLVLIGRVLPSS